MLKLHDFCNRAVLHNRGRWWLFPDQPREGMPPAVALSGRLTPAATEFYNPLQADYTLGAGIEALNSGSLCWRGKLVLVPSHTDTTLFDIDAHWLIEEIDERETRRLRMLIDAMFHSLPAGFVSVATAMPSCDTPVLAIRYSGYQSAVFEVLTAKYRPDRNPATPWRTLNGNAVSDHGTEIIGWADGTTWLAPA
ncbi:hypothetical protein KNJ79_19550 [Sphingopyxis indica]|uniref:hypothetical protein n=1 Tax=Sphingopyxis indica TaxID=436663 RepID=UPI0029391EC8|nr:hypothetical protein [Sphingopyxis indica]WOF43273.1 hypothetical protein KNJ79_19550 [Sphingopyxis indica]